MEGKALAYHAIKRCLDIIVSLVAIIILFIPSIVLCIAIYVESPGHPFFCPKRIGRYGKEIRIFKFRSMYVDAARNPEKYLSGNQMSQWSREQKVDEDPRVTRVGRFIRKTSIDEIPQFLNVLIGDMSIVGPRPVTLKETYEFGDDRDEVLSVRPGITGWWQVTDRNDATWENGRRQELELEYVRNQGFLMDIEIFFLTFRAVLMGTGK